MAKTSYPDLSIKDDWNDRTPKPVTSLADDIAKASNEPQLGLYHDPDTEFVETSAGAVPVDSEQAKAAADVAMKEPKEPETGTEDAPSSGAEQTGGEDEKPVAKSVSRKSTTTS